MDFLKNFLKNDKTVVGLCDLKRRQTVNSFNLERLNNFSRPFAEREIPGVLLYAK